MSMAAEHGGKGYAPLPQSMSNTDTENEDDEVESRDYSPDKHSHKSMKHDSTVIQENGRFYPLDETKNLANRLRNGRNNINLSLGYCSDDIPIMVVDQDANDDLWKRPHMSVVRQFFLAASILLCIATILIFLYVLPCNDYDEFPPLNIKNRPALLWENTTRGIELRGPISVVPGVPYNLIFMFRGQLYGGGSEMEGPRVPASEGGVISLHGRNGLLLWWVSLKHSPTEMDCDNLDPDGDGKPDCLVAGEEGLLVSIAQQTGILQWTSATKTHSKLPVFLPDIDNDRIGDILTVQITDDRTLGLALISGRNGQLLGHHLRPDCHRIHIYSVDLNATVSYICHDSNNKQSMKTISLTELYETMNLQQVKRRLLAKQKDLPNPYIIPERNLDERILALTPYHQLAVQRRGSCPGDLCQTTLNVTFQSKRSSNESNSIWSSSGSNAYGMDPVSLTDIEKPSVTGFVMKFWQWNTPDSNQLDKINSSVVRRTITEWTSVVIINQTEVHAVNASQTDITQICNEAECQPSLKLQSQSLLVSDLNHDGYRELISYQTSYELEREVFVLKSKVQVVRLDLEVAKLTQTVVV